MGGTDEFDLKKFLKGVKDAIPKYEKTLKFLEAQILEAEFPLEEELEGEAQKIRETISNLELTLELYSQDLPQEVELIEKVVLEEREGEEEEEEIPKDVNKEEVTTKSREDIASFPQLLGHLREILGNQESAQKLTWKLFFTGIGVGGVIGFLASYAVVLLTQQELPQIIFTNGTIIYP